MISDGDQGDSDPSRSIIESPDVPEIVAPPRTEQLTNRSPGTLLLLFIATKDHEICHFMQSQTSSNCKIEAVNNVAHFSN